MSDNTIINQNTTVGDKIRDIDRGSNIKSQVVILDVQDGAGGESLCNGSVPTKDKTTATQPSQFSVDSDTAAVVLIGQHASRRGLVVVNDSSQVLYISFNSSPSSTSYAYKVAAGATWTMGSPIYTGAVYGAWAGINGKAYVTEWT